MTFSCLFTVIDVTGKCICLLMIAYSVLVGLLYLVAFSPYSVFRVKDI
jgi:hypothetical protein